MRGSKQPAEVYHVQDHNQIKRTLHGHGPHLLQSPVLAHVLSAKLSNLFVEMLEECRSKTVKDLFELAGSVLLLAALTRFHVLLKPLKAFVNQLVVRQELQLLAESWHLLGQDREDMLLLDGVVHGELPAELKDD